MTWFAEFKKIHSDKCNLSDPQYRLWAKMITNGLHSSKETPPYVPMITGTTPTGATRISIEETVAGTVTAVVKGMGAAQMQPNTLALQSSLAIPILKLHWEYHQAKLSRLKENASLDWLACSSCLKSQC